MTERWYIVDSKNSRRSAYVKAETWLGALRVFAQAFGDDYAVDVEDDTISDDAFDFVEYVDTPEPPYCALQEEDHGIVMYEKRVNQAGSKGIYTVQMT